MIELVVADLICTGRSVAFLDRPDRNTQRDDGLTVDAELMVDAERWAMDVTTLRWQSGLEGAVEFDVDRVHGKVRVCLDNWADALDFLGVVVEDVEEAEFTRRHGPSVVEVAPKAIRHLTAMEDLSLVGESVA